MKIIVTGHGKFASGIESTVKLLAGSIEGVRYIDFEDGMTDVTLMQKLEKASGESRVIFFCDLIGGTPYKQAAMIQKNRGIDEVAVVAGCNVGSLLEIGLQNNLKELNSIHDVAQMLIETSKNGTQEFGKKKITLDQSDSDGI